MPTSDTTEQQGEGRLPLPEAFVPWAVSLQLRGFEVHCYAGLGDLLPRYYAVLVNSGGAICRAKFADTVTQALEALRELVP